MNSNITTIEQRQTMTSLEIANLTGKNHKHVMRDIRNMLEELWGDRPTSGLITSDYKDSGGRAQQLYKLDYELTMTLITGYSIKLRSAVIKRWQELEKQAATEQPAPADMHAYLNDPVILRSTPLVYTEKVLELQETVTNSGEYRTSFRTMVTGNGLTYIHKVLSVPAPAITYQH